jgi:hypothetical protein
LCSFAGSVMSIEFVTLILTGINNFLEVSRENQSVIRKSIPQNKHVISERNGSVLIKYDKVNFDDVELWNVN